MFELEQKFFRNDNNELMLNLSVWGLDNLRKEIKIFKFSQINEIKQYLDDIKVQYTEIVINWNKIKNELDKFYNREKWG
jgi:nucleosome binding factor SPN SPT16 subunit